MSGSLLDHRLTIDRLGRSNSLRSRAYDALRAAITAMDIYAPDAQLKLDERDLSARFGISRTPLREALSSLDREGVVHVVARRGVFIVRKSRRELEEMIAVWAALEALAARLAIDTASDAEFDALRDLIGASGVGGTTAASNYAEANIGFHRAIIAAGRNSIADQMSSELLFHVAAVRRHMVWNEQRRARSIADHHKIVTALQMRDADEVERLVRTHTLGMREHIDEIIAVN